MIDNSLIQNGLSPNVTPIASNFTDLQAQITNASVYNPISGAYTAGDLSISNGSLTVNSYINAGSGYVLGNVLMSKSDMWVNFDYTGGFASPTIWFNAQEQHLKWDDNEDRFEFSENLKVDGTSLYIGSGDINDDYIWFGSSIVDQGIGIRANYGTPKKIEYTFDSGNSWNIMTIPVDWEGTYPETLAAGNKAYAYEAYTGKYWARGAVDDSYIKLDPGTGTGDLTVAFQPSGSSEETLHWSQTHSDFRFSNHLYVLASVTATSDVKSGASLFADYDSNASACAVYFHGTDASLMWNNTDNKFILNQALDVAGSIRSASNHLGLNVDYITGDENCTINFNASNYSLKWDYGEDRFEFSNNLYVDGSLVTTGDVTVGGNEVSIGDGVDEDVIITFDNNFTHPAKIWADENSGLVMVRNGSHLPEPSGSWVMSGSTGDGDGIPVYDLDDVTDAGAITDNDITVGHISGSYFNASVSGSQFNSLFIEDDLQVADDLIVNGTIAVYTSGSQFNTLTIDNNLQVGGDVLADGNIYTNVIGPDGNSYLYFYEGDSPTGAHLRWQNSYAGFYLSHKLNVPNVYCTGIDVSGVAEASDFRSDGNIYINFPGAEGDSFLYFYENGGYAGASLKWDDDPGEFVLSHGLNVPNVYCTGNDYGLHVASKILAGGDIDSGGTITGLNLMSQAGVFINQYYDDQDAYIVFRKPTSGDETLIWDKTDERFEFSAKLYVDGDLEVTGNITGVNTIRVLYSENHKQAAADEDAPNLETLSVKTKDGVQDDAIVLRGIYWKRTEDTIVTFAYKATDNADGNCHVKCIVGAVSDTQVTTSGVVSYIKELDVSGLSDDTAYEWNITLRVYESGGIDKQTSLTEVQVYVGAL